MKKVDLLFSGWIKAPNGAAKFVKELNLYKKVFSNRGVDLNVYSKDNILPKEFNNTCKLKYKENKKSTLIHLACYSYLLTLVLFYYLYFRHSKLIVNQYILSRKSVPDIIHFQDPITCYYFLRKYGDNNSIIILEFENKIEEGIHHILKIKNIEKNSCETDMAATFCSDSESLYNIIGRTPALHSLHAICIHPIPV